MLASLFCFLSLVNLELDCPQQSKRQGEHNELDFCEGRHARDNFAGLCCIASDAIAMRILSDPITITNSIHTLVVLHAQQLNEIYDSHKVTKHWRYVTC